MLVRAADNITTPSYMKCRLDYNPTINSFKVKAIHLVQVIMDEVIVCQIERFPLYGFPE